MTDEQKQQIIRLRKKGCGYTAVANKVGISKDTVKSFCRRNGLAGEMAAVQEDSVPGLRTATRQSWTEAPSGGCRRRSGAGVPKGILPIQG